MAEPQATARGGMQATVSVPLHESQFIERLNSKTKEAKRIKDEAKAKSEAAAIAAQALSRQTSSTAQQERVRANRKRMGSSADISTFGGVHMAAHGHMWKESQLPPTLTDGSGLSYTRLLTQTVRYFLVLDMERELCHCLSVFLLQQCQWETCCTAPDSLSVFTLVVPTN